MPAMIGAKRGAIAGTKVEIAIAPRPFRCESRGMTRVPPHFLKGEIESSIQQFVEIWLFIIAQLISVFGSSRPKTTSALTATLIS